MTIKKTAMIAMASAGLLAAVQQTQATSFNFSSIANPGSSIQFNGDSTFEFVPNAPGPNFQIDNGAAAGLKGTITGLYTIGAGTPTAPVTGTGTFTIDGGLPGPGDDLTANVQWLFINQTGTGGSLNTFGSINLSSIAYSGANVDLLALANAPAGKATVAFSFNDPLSLDDLRGGAFNTTFAGTVSTVERTLPDGGATAVLLGLGTLGLGVARRIRK